MSIRIRKFKEEDIPLKVRWINNKENNKFLHYDLPLEIEKTKVWFDKNCELETRFDGVILYNEKPVGIIGLINIDQKNKKAEYYITLGEKESLGKGIATEASLQLLEFAFEVLCLKRIYLYTEVDNIKAQNLFERIGFQKEGTLRNDLVVNYKFIDRYLYSITKFDEKKIISQIYPIQTCCSENQYFIMREDLIPFSFGGNKARKAKFFFEDILRKKANCIITYGSSSSNHCRIIANLARKYDLECIIITPEENYIKSNNAMLIDLFQAQIFKTPVKNVSETINIIIKNQKSLGKVPYFIPGGGHGNLGTKAYIEAYDEIKAYEIRRGVHFDYIFHTSGTGTTQAGLICGQILNGDKRHIIGISNARKNPYGGKVVLDSVKDYLKSSGNRIDATEYVHFIDDYTLEGYGFYNRAIVESIKNLMTQDGIPLDTTYTGKGFWGMKEYIKKREITEKNILFIHTGGTSLFFDDLEEIAYEKRD